MCKAQVPIAGGAVIMTTSSPQVEGPISIGILAARVCFTCAPNEWLGTGVELPCCRGAGGFTFECVSFAPHFHEFSGL